MGPILAHRANHWKIPGLPAECITTRSSWCWANIGIVVDCGSTSVRGNVITKPDPDPVRLSLSVRLASYCVGTDAAGTEAIGFGFEPASER